ncbi:MAG TPA: hypothetical protein VM097_09050 [Mycobacteriales bacterium]|nr:hypothetical protein [Mycobacteriales bacterium]
MPVIGVGIAAADDASLTPSNSAYFFSKGIDKPEEAPAPPPNATALAADGVSAGNLAVAANAGAEDKVSFLYFDLFSVPTDATVSQAVVTMTPLPASPTDVSFNASPDKVVACAAGPEGFKDDDGAGLVNAPARLCTQFKAVGKAAAAAYAWDVTTLAQQWVAGTNDGVAFTRADEAPGSNFQVVFGPAATAKLTVSYTVPDTFVPPFVPPVAPPVVGPPVVGGGLPPVTDPFVPTPDVIVPNPQPNVVPTPQPSTVTPTRTVALSTSMRPTNQLWLAGAGLLGLLVLVSLVLGDPSVPTTGRSRTRLSQALEGRGATPSLRARPL